MQRNRNEAEKVLQLTKTLGFLRVKNELFHGMHPEHLRRLGATAQLLRTIPPRPCPALIKIRIDFIIINA